MLWAEGPVGSFNWMSIARILDLQEAFDDPLARERIVAQFNQAARANTDAGARW